NRQPRDTEMGRQVTIVLYDALGSNLRRDKRARLSWHGECRDYQGLISSTLRREESIANCARTAVAGEDAPSPRHLLKKRIMMHPNFSTPPRRTGLPPRRIALLGSVAAVAAVMLLGGPNGFRQLQPAPFTGVAQAAETTLQHPADFSDLIAKVKPAVISVRVK